MAWSETWDRVGPWCIIWAICPAPRCSPLVVQSSAPTGDNATSPEAVEFTGLLGGGGIPPFGKHLNPRTHSLLPTLIMPPPTAPLGFQMPKHANYHPHCGDTLLLPLISALEGPHLPRPSASDAEGHGSGRGRSRKVRSLLANFCAQRLLLTLDSHAL